MDNTVKMNTKWTLIGGIAAGVVVLIIAGVWFYSAAMWSILIDNPTDKDIVVNINNTDYPVAAQSNEKVKLPFGSAEYKVLVDTQEVGTFKKWMLDGNALINPTMSTYVKQTFIYADSLDIKDGKEDAKIVEKTICLNGQNYDGDNLVTYKDLYILKDWNYGIDTISPDTMKPNKWPKTARYATTDELFSAQKFMSDNTGYGTCS